MPTRVITIFVRASGARKAAGDLDRVTSSLHGITGMARAAGLGIASLAGYAIHTGIKFNATMESQTVALEGFLGSTQAATKYLDELFEIAANTPFRFEDVVRASRTLIAYGRSASDAKKTVTLLGNAIAASGQFSSDAINRSTLALGQIASAGVLHAQDLNQLIQTGVVTVDKLAGRMGMSGLEFRKAMEDGLVTADTFFKHMQDSWANDPMYKGAAAKQAATFQGQLEKLKDYTQRTLGTVTEPLFNALRNNALPALVDFTQDVEAIFKRTGIDMEEKIFLTKEAANKRLKPLADSFKEWWKREKIGDRLLDAFEVTLREMAKVAGRAIPDMMKAGFRAFWDSGPATQGITAALIASKLGLTRKAMGGIWGLLSRRVKGGKGGGLLGGAMGTITNPMYVIVLAEPGSKGGSFIKNAAKAGAPWAVRALKVGGPALAAFGIVEVLKAIGQHNYPTNVPATRRRESSGHVPFIPGRLERAPGPSMLPSYPTPNIPGWGYTGPAAPSPYAIQPAQPNPLVIPIELKLDGKVVAKTVVRRGVQRQATR